jgi:hypothetical protein
MKTILAFMAGLDPKVLYTATAGVVWLTIYAWRKVSMASWDAVTRQNPLLQNLPAMVLSGLISAAPHFDKGFVTALVDIVYGAATAGSLSIVSHHMLKDSPLPYQGGGPAPKPADVTS